MQTFSEHDTRNTKGPAHALLSALANKWAILVLASMNSGKTRFSAMQKYVATISPKTLTQVLRNLEQQGIIQRTATLTVPVTVEYSVTKKGHEFWKFCCRLEELIEQTTENELERARDLAASPSASGKAALISSSSKAGSPKKTRRSL
jgi:DNA-binding HxlR family transcriptional regulator